MNIQQFSNPQFWTSLFPNWWSVIINIIDIALVGLLVVIIATEILVPGSAVH